MYTRRGHLSVTVLAERVQYMDKDGKLVTESLKDYTRKAVRKDYETLDDFLRHWTDAERKHVIIEELREHGVFFEACIRFTDRGSDVAFTVANAHRGATPQPMQGSTRGQAPPRAAPLFIFAPAEDQARLRPVIAALTGATDAATPCGAGVPAPTMSARREGSLQRCGPAQRGNED